MSSTITEVIFLSIFSFWAWKLYLFFFDKSALSDIPGPPNPSMFKGNFRQIFDRKGLQFHLDLLEKYGGAVKIHGPFGEEQVYVSDPRALHYITVKEQNIYDEVPGFYASNEMVFGTSLLSTKGDQHRKQRKMLNPVFSLKHMRDLAPIFYPIAHRLRDLLREKVRKGEGKELNVMKWMSRAALEYIGQGGLGYSFDALDESKTNKYSEAVRMLAPTAFNLYLFRQYTHYIKKLGSPAFRLFLLKLTPWPDLHKVKKIVDVMDETSIAIYNEKKEKLRLGDEAVVNQVGRGKDIMSVLLQANMAANEADRLPEEELLGQMNTFIFAGHDTTTSALSRILHVLTLNPEMQVKLREELTEALKEHGEEMDYDTLMALPYLDSVCREVMRLYPPAPLLNRVTMQPTTLPLYRPIKTIAGELIQSIPLKKNTRVVVSLLGANRNKDVWGEDADEFKPERWLAKRVREAKQDNWFEEKKEESDKAALPGVYSGMMTFSGGGRACIGFKFSELEMKIVLSVIIPALKFSLVPGKEIEWNMGNIQSPVMKGETGIEPKLPLKVELA